LVTVCTVASRFYTKRTDNLYGKCLAVAKRSAFTFMNKGWKSPEIAQAFLLLSKWNQPAERYEEEITCSFSFCLHFQVRDARLMGVRGTDQMSGLAIRLAMDLNLQRKSPLVLPEGVSEQARKDFEQEVMNRSRTWIMCFITDRRYALPISPICGDTHECGWVRQSVDSNGKVALYQQGRCDHEERENVVATAGGGGAR